MGEREEAAANKTQNEVSGCLEQMKKKKKKNNSSCGGNDKRRFSDEQIKLLESIFETETRLEPKKKLQVARELGLQPRQVAIWFQNRRARWKSKRIEQEYRLLRDSYDNLLSRVELLKNEKQSLLLQVQKLSALLGKPREGSTTRSDKLMEGSDEGKIALEEDTRNENRETGAQLEVDKKTAAMRSDDEKRSRDVGDSGDQGRQLINSKHGDDYHCGGGSVASFDQRWYGGLASSQAQLDDLPCSSSQWFDSWI